MRSYKIAVVGKRNHLSWDCYVRDAFLQMGHHVTHHQFNRYCFWIQIIRGVMVCLFGKKKVQEISAHWHSKVWLREIEKVQPDLVFMVMGSFIPVDYFRAARKISPTVKVFVWEGDGILNLSELGPYVDYVFEAGNVIRRAYPDYQDAIMTLPFAVSSETYSNFNRERWNCVYFCGAWGTYRDCFIRRLHDLPVVIRGWEWEKIKKDFPSMMIKNIKLSNKQLAREQNGYTIGINIVNLPPGENSWINMRTFEVPACGMCLVMQRTPFLENCFVFGEEIVVFDTPDELHEKLEYLLSNPEEAARIAKAGEARVWRDHTYVSRMEKVVQVYEKCFMANAGHSMIGVQV